MIYYLTNVSDNHNSITNKHLHIKKKKQKEKQTSFMPTPDRD
jgi:hypothetical protein